MAKLQSKKAKPVTVKKVKKKKSESEFPDNGEILTHDDSVNEGILKEHEKSKYSFSSV